MITFEATEMKTDELRQSQAELIAEDFITFFNQFHSYQQPFDDALDIYLHTCYLNALKRGKTFPRGKRYFSPSSANSDARELYEKMTGAKRDSREVKPFQRRWTSLGTAIGDMVQREILLAEKHFKRFTGKDPRFTFERTELNEPAFEDFVMYPKDIEHNGKKFQLFGTCDGILLYKTDDGETIRVGLEIKSKQTTSSSLGVRFNKPSQDHVKQCVCYSMMYDVDYYIILYVNASKKGWFMSDEDFRKTPDVKAFGIYITDEMRNEVKDYFVEVLDHVDTKTPPPLDITKWTFNNFKTATALSLSKTELDELKKQVAAYQKSNVRFKGQIVDAYYDILRIREESGI